MLIILLFQFSFTDAKTLRVAAVQIKCEVGELDSNLLHGGRLIREAFKNDADLVVLPEFFTTIGFGFPFNKKILDAVEPLDGKTIKLFKELAKEYNGIIGGSFLAFHGDNTCNSFILVFPL